MARELVEMRNRDRGASMTPGHNRFWSISVAFRSRAATFILAW